MIPETPLYGFCIGTGYTREELGKILDRNLQKLEENYRFFMNGAFRGAFGASTGAFKLKKCARFDYAIRFEPRPHV